MAAVAVAVIGLAGVAKLLGAGGTAPEWFPEGLGPYPLFLRGVGLVEVVLALGYAHPSLREVVRSVVKLLVSGFAFVIALSGGDDPFLGDCGCLGGAPGVLGALEASSAPALLARNALFIAALDAHRWMGSRGGTTRLLQWATLFAMLVALAHGRRVEVTERRLDSAIVGLSQRSGTPVALPRIAVELEGGPSADLARLIGLNGAVIVYSPACGACETSVPRWTRIKAVVASEGGALHWLNLAGGRSPGSGWAAEVAPRSWRLVHRDDRLRLGIATVPQVIATDDRGRLDVRRSARLTAELTQQTTERGQ